jgi:YbbR domain-containing protein
MIRALYQNWQRKLLAGLLAAGVWLFVASAQRVEIALAVPVEYVGLEGPLVLAGPHREMVEVHLQAGRGAAERVTPASVRVRVDVARLQEGENIVYLVPERVETPPGVRVTRVSPAWASVRLVQAATRTVPVVPRLLGEPADDHVVGRVIVDPPTVQIKGPRTTIEARDAVDTLPVDVSGQREPLTRTVGLALPDSVYPVNQRAVAVTVEIQPEDKMRKASPGAAGR